MDTGVIIAIVVIVLIAIILLVIFVFPAEEKIKQITIAPVTTFSVESDKTDQRGIIDRIKDFAQTFNILLIEVPNQQVAFIRWTTNKDEKIITFDQKNFRNAYLQAMGEMGKIVKNSLNSSKVPVPIFKPIEQMPEPVKEPIKIVEVSYSLVPSFSKYPQYSANTQKLLEGELLRLCKVAGVQPTKHQDKPGFIEFVTNTKKVYRENLENDYISEFGITFLNMSKILNDKMRFPGVPIKIWDFDLASAEFNNPNIIALPERTIARENKRRVIPGVLSLEFKNTSFLGNYILGNPTLQSYADRKSVV